MSILKLVKMLQLPQSDSFSARSAPFSRNTR